LEVILIEFSLSEFAFLMFFNKYKKNREKLTVFALGDVRKYLIRVFYLYSFYDSIEEKKDKVMSFFENFETY